jgi:hypothetical protein
MSRVETERNYYITKNLVIVDIRLGSRMLDTCDAEGMRGGRRRLRLKKMDIFKIT